MLENPKLDDLVISDTASRACREQMEFVERHLRLLVDGGTPIERIALAYPYPNRVQITVDGEPVFEHAIVFTVDGQPWPKSGLLHW